MLSLLSDTTATDLATFQIFSDGSQIDDEFAVKSISIVKNINKISSAEIVLLDGSIADEDFPSSNKDEFLPGAEIEIKMGYRGEDEVVFKGIVIKHGIKGREGMASVLYVEMKDIAIKMTIGRKNKYFKEVTDSDIIEEIIGEYGIAADVEAMTVTHKEMIQYYCTDWDFVVTRAEANGKLVLVDDEGLSIKAPDLSNASGLELIYGQGIVEFETEMDARDQFSGTNTKAWDYTRQEVIESDGTDPGFSEQGNVSTSDLAGVIDIDTLPFQHTGKVEDTELQAWSDACLMRSKLSKIKGRIRMIGNAAIKPGQTVELAGLGDRFNGTAFVTGVGHFYGNESIWYTDLYIGFCQKWLIEKYDNVIAKPSSGLLAPMQGLHIALVTAIHDDPDGEDRIQIKIPIIDPEDEGIWARVSSLDAGENRGAFFRPEVGDEVVVGFLNDDPRDAVVLGMLNSSAKPAPETAAEENDIKGFYTRSEMKFLFNDGVNSITMETPNGNKILISEEDAGITIEDENSNKIVMNADGISIESAKDIILKASGDIKMEGTNIEQKASANFKAEGGSGLEVSSSATTTVKGSLVQIN